MPSEPFLTYLTVFKSRLGLANLVLQLSGLAHQPDAALLRKLRLVLEKTEELRLDDPANAQIFQYLKDKRLISREGGGNGRYSQYSSLEVVDSHWQVHGRHGDLVPVARIHVTDIWLSSSAIPSTIGVPTPDNVREPFELAFQLRLLSKAKNTWTAAGQLTNNLRARASVNIADASNPLLLGVEAVSLLRQVIAVDGLILTELVRTVLESNSGLVTRDRVAQAFPTIVDRAIARAKDLKFSAALVRQATDFRRTVQKTVVNRARIAKRDSTASGAPGLLEHRVSPRLEWLTDLGYLTKEGLAKNGFEYRITDSLNQLLQDLDHLVSGQDWPEEVAIKQWATNPAWRTLRDRVATYEWPDAFREGYQLMHRRIGPVSLRDMTFALCILDARGATFQQSVADVIAFAQNTKGATLSGGRYTRTPENIFVTGWSAAENAE